MNAFLSTALACLFIAPGFSWADTAPPMKTIEIEWEADEKVGGYEVQLIPEKGGKRLRFFTEESKLSQTVPTGKYKLRIRARAKDADYFSPWSDPVPFEVVEKEIVPLKPEDRAVIAAKEQKKQTIEFEWMPVDKVKEYTVKVWTEKRKETPWVFTVKTNKTKLDVPPGEIYYWQVLFESASGISYAQSPTTFTFTLLGAKLTSPDIGPLEINPREQKISWHESPGATTYQAKLFFRHLDETEWALSQEASLSETTWSFTDLKRGNYKIEVVATAARRTPSDPAIAEFVVKPSHDELRWALQASQPKDSAPRPIR